MIAAKTAFKNGSWSNLDPQVRAFYLLKLSTLIEEHSTEIGILESLDQGKPFKAALDTIKYAIQNIRYIASLADKLFDRKMATTDALCYVKKEPIGVVGAITPWNFPFAIAANKIVAAIAVGNCIVLKSSEHTPLSVLRLAELVKEAEFPPGVINIITGYGNVAGDALAKHPHVNMVSFTGSTAVGKQIMINAAATFKRIHLELGGKSPAIVCADAALHHATTTVCNSIFNNSGQCCNALSRVYVHESVYDEFLDIATGLAVNRKIAAAFIPLDETEETKEMKQHHQQHPFINIKDSDADQGPMTTESQFRKTLQYIQEGINEGAKLFCGGQKVHNQGRYIENTIFTEVQPHMKIFKDEIFGPVLCVIKFKDDDEAITMANDTNYGLWSAVFTNSIHRAQRYINCIESGSVNVNCSKIVPGMPFGGFKMSGIGREFGLEGLEQYTEMKSVIISDINE